VTGGAGTERGVEREGARLELLEREVVVQAGKVLGEGALARRVVGRQVDEVEDDEAAGESQRRLDRVGESALGGGLDGQPVDDDLDRVLLLLVEHRRLDERVGLTVDSHPAEALRLQLAEEVGVLPLAAPDHRRQYLEAAPLVELEHAVDDLLRSLPAQWDGRRPGSADDPRGRTAGADSHRPP
jgi:hypothetical protein